MSWYDRAPFECEPTTTRLAKIVRLGQRIVVGFPIVIAISAPVYKGMHPGRMQQTERESLYKMSLTVNENSVRPLWKGSMLGPSSTIRLAEAPTEYEVQEESRAVIRHPR
jgi:hypothetical protein